VAADGPQAVPQRGSDIRIISGSFSGPLIIVEPGNYLAHPSQRGLGISLVEPEGLFPSPGGGKPSPFLSHTPDNTPRLKREDALSAEGDRPDFASHDLGTCIRLLKIFCNLQCFELLCESPAYCLQICLFLIGPGVRLGHKAMSNLMGYETHKGFV